MFDEQLHLIQPEAPLSRDEATARLEGYLNHDLRDLATEYGVTVWKDGALNKGWAGHVVERILGLTPNAEQKPDFGDWELKVVPLVFSASGDVTAKESMSITMFTEAHILDHEFEQSHLLEKLERLLVVARAYVDSVESTSPLVAVRSFDLGRGPLFDAIRADYEDIRWTVRNDGVYGVHGGIGRLVQPRVKGGAGSGYQGHGFYGRSRLVNHVLGLTDCLAPDGDTSIV